MTIFISIKHYTNDLKMYVIKLNSFVLNFMFNYTDFSNFRKCFLVEILNHNDLVM